MYVSTYRGRLEERVRDLHAGRLVSCCSCSSLLVSVSNVCIKVSLGEITPTTTSIVITVRIIHSE